MPMNVAENFSKVQLVAFDFDGVFTDNAVYVSQDGNETVRCWRGDGLGLARLRSVGVPIFIVSSLPSFFTYSSTSLKSLPAF